MYTSFKQKVNSVQIFLKLSLRENCLSQPINQHLCKAYQNIFIHLLACLKVGMEKHFGYYLYSKYFTFPLSWINLNQKKD